MPLPNSLGQVELQGRQVDLSRRLICPGGHVWSLNKCNPIQIDLNNVFFYILYKQVENMHNSGSWASKIFSICQAQTEMILSIYKNPIPGPTVLLYTIREKPLNLITHSLAD